MEKEDTPLVKAEDEPTIEEEKAAPSQDLFVTTIDQSSHPHTDDYAEATQIEEPALAQLNVEEAQQENEAPVIEEAKVEETAPETLSES